MDIPKVSIVIPVFNVQKYLHRCIDSLRNQTLYDIEIILVNDGSTDDSGRICDEYMELDSRVKVIHKKNAGLGYARNSGLEIATGQFIGFVDSDDFVSPEMYETLYIKAIQYQSEIVACSYFLQGEDYCLSKSNFERDIILEDDLISEFCLDIVSGAPTEKKEKLYPVSVWVGIFSNHLIKSNKIVFDSERDIVSEDIPFRIRTALLAKKIVIIPNTLYYYCQNESSLSKTFLIEKFLRFIKLKILLEQLLININGYQNRTNRFFIDYTRGYLLQNVEFNNKKEAITIIQQVCENEIWSNIYREFPFKKSPVFSKRIVYYLTVTNRHIFLYYYLKVFLSFKKLLNSNKH